MREFQTLKFLDFFKSIFIKFGIDYDVMRRILQVKLLMDQRRVPTIFNQSKKKNPDQNHFLKSLWMYVLLGALLIPFMILGENYLFQASIILGVVMFLTMTSMISDFSSVLLDIRDKTVLSTKPVERKTISMAKTIHVCIYLFFLSGALTFPSMIAGLIKHGILFTIIFLLEIVLINMLIVVITAMIYFSILKFFDGEKLKDLINYVQIGLSIMIAVGYQFIARSFDIMNLDIVFVPSWWQFLIPPIWYGAPFELLLNGQYSPFYFGLSMLALFVPIMAIMIYIKMMPAFEKHLQKLSNHHGTKGKKQSRWKLWIMNILCFSKEEKAFYRFSELMMKNEREFRLKVYPSLGFSFVFPFIFIMNQLTINTFSEIASSKWYLSIYFCSIVIPTAVMMIKYSGKYKGAWIYKAAPIKDWHALYHGTMKAFIVNLYLPVFLSVSMIFIFIFGLRIIPDLIIVLLSSLLFAYFCMKILLKSLPFSESFDDAQKEMGLKVLPFMLLIGLLCGIHYISLLIPWGAWLYTVILIFVQVLIWANPFRSRSKVLGKQHPLDI
ncbi:hypothetical protein ABE096_05035 [Robertmurraya massiliosenegalensis]|uniref:hypothetical protein n=1 Tax=Robertmurraya TaxID=2837507 RepID=UPI0039A4760F